MESVNSCIMESVNSLSGGRTSSYIAANYPADIDIFALCCIDDHNAGAGIDKKLIQMANDKLQKYCAHMPEFVATSEDPTILKTMFDLEQMIGREITWVRGIGWNEMIRQKNAIPNRAKRFCTTILKMQPIFEFLYMRTELPVNMRIGFRHDEDHRANSENTTFKFAKYAQKYSGRIVNDFDKLKAKYQSYFFEWMYKWETITWRTNEYPLIDDKVNHYQIVKFWEDKNIVFPQDSNCLNCFWKDPMQLRKNFDTYAPVMLWSMIAEELQGNTFRDDLSFRSIMELPIEQSFFFGTGAGCQAGFCTS